MNFDDSDKTPLHCSESLHDSDIDMSASLSSFSMEGLNDYSMPTEDEPQGESLGSTDSFSLSADTSEVSPRHIRELKKEWADGRLMLVRQDATVGDDAGEDSDLDRYPEEPLNGTQGQPIEISSEEEPALPLPPPADVAEPVAEPTPIRAARAQFRLQAKFFFLTWPQCDTPKETVLERIKAIANYSHAVVCREDHHEDDGVHLHAFVALTKPWNLRNPHYLDALADKHGNYQAARDQLAVVKYVMKDGDYIFHGFDPVEFVQLREKKKSSKPSLTAEVAKKVREDQASLDAIDDFAPAFVLANKRKLQEYISYQKVKRAALAKQLWVPLDLSLFPDADFNFKIAKWITENIKQPREFKQKQLYIWSEGPNAGKTHLVNELTKYLNVYHVPKTRFVCGYESDRFDLLVIDEFKSDFTIQFLNEFLQGSTMHLDQKGSSTIKTDNPPCIILSNLELSAVYHKKCNTGPFNALCSRLKIIKVPNGKKIDLWKTLPVVQ